MREIGTNKRSLFCQCELLKLHTHIKNECFDMPMKEHIQRGWFTIKYSNYNCEMKKKFNDFFSSHFFNTLESQITYCIIHNMQYAIGWNKKVILKTKWLGEIYNMYYDFTGNTPCTFLNKCQWMRQRCTKCFVKQKRTQTCTVYKYIQQ